MSRAPLVTLSLVVLLSAGGAQAHTTGHPLTAREALERTLPLARHWAKHPYVTVIANQDSFNAESAPVSAADAKTGKARTWIIAYNTGSRVVLEVVVYDGKIVSHRTTTLPRGAWFPPRLPLFWMDSPRAMRLAIRSYSWHHIAPSRVIAVTQLATFRGTAAPAWEVTFWMVHPPDGLSYVYRVNAENGSVTFVRTFRGHDVG